MPPKEGAQWERPQPLSISGTIDEVVLESTVSHDYAREPIKGFPRNPEFINGLRTSKLELREHFPIEEAKQARLTTPNSSDYNGIRTIEFSDNFPPGSVFVLQVSLLPQAKSHVIALRKCLAELHVETSEFHSIVSQLSLIDLERVLYRASVEEQADGKGFDVYEIPEYGKLVYCGLQGIMSILEKIRLTNELTHPLVTHIKQGNWLIEYIANRLVIHPGTQKIGEWFRAAFSHVGALPRYLVPAYFDAIITGSYTVLLEHGWSQMSKFVRDGSTFARALAQSSVQLVGIVRSARLPPLSPNLKEPRPPEEVDEFTHEKVALCPTLAAGFPHFGAGIWRNWGRDTFISLRGLLLLTGRFEEARYLILGYGGCLRHGLIPNLLGDGRIARYNARDAVWWWLLSISSYTQLAPDGVDLLSDRVSRIYPTHDSAPQAAGAHNQSLYDVIQEVLLRHMQSLSFRERGAGFSLDSDMNDEGFNNRIGVDFETGFVFGGNRWNCGTWMDKMGSSEKAGNKGHPATPRDGSAVELIGLCRATLTWLIDMHAQGHYPYESVETSTTTGAKLKLRFVDWAAKIDANFEKEFWVGDESTSQYINRRQIYKDTVNSSLPWADYQLRPNFLVAAVVAPQMFDKDHIWQALKQTELVLLGRYGMKTLDPNDHQYVGDYVNDDDGYDYKRARGHNYHNGPEWLWLMGYYLRARLLWAQRLQNEEGSEPNLLQTTVRHVRDILTAHQELIFASDWKGLPELTNANGYPCPYSCNVQAWSSATLLETIYDLARVY